MEGDQHSPARDKIMADGARSEVITEWIRSEREARGVDLLECGMAALPGLAPNPTYLNQPSSCVSVLSAISLL